jgi:site-specific recombinase XerD
MLNAKKSIRKMLFGNKKSSIRSPSSSNVNSLISPTQKTEKKIPLVIDMEERIKIDKIEKKTQSNHRLNIIGLRVSEVINLKLSDINSNLMQIEIRGAKGKKTALYH